MTIRDDLSQTYNQALALEKAGDYQHAATLYRECLQLDPTDLCGASVRLASMGLADAPEKAPEAYVAALFSQHADDFDDILTGQLGYAVPMQAAQMLHRDAPGPYARMLDLGCGTGLSGSELQDICDFAIGVDLSEGMIDKADERACYDELYINDAVHFLEEWAREQREGFDLIVATDVFPYIGALEALFEGLRKCARKNARIVFSSETLPADQMKTPNWSITPHQRFAHSADYLKRMCVSHGFAEITHFDNIVVRYDNGKPIEGYLVIAHRPQVF